MPKDLKKRGNLGITGKNNRNVQLRSSGISEQDDSLFGELLRKGYDDDFEPDRECFPTAHPPGSVGKIEVLSMRLQRGEPLWHPGDESVLATNRENRELIEFVKRGKL